MNRLEMEKAMKKSAEEDNDIDYKYINTDRIETLSNIVDGLNKKVDDLIVDLNDIVNSAKTLDDDRPYKCPCCDGTGLTVYPPGVAPGQIYDSATFEINYPCHSCRGTGVIWKKVSEFVNGL